MKKLQLLLLTLLIPFLGFTQTPDSWVQFVVQYDFYSPTESNFFMVEDTVLGDTVMFHQPTTPYQFLDTIIDVNSGNYVVTLTDNFGDGWISNSPAWFKMSNTCQGPILTYNPLDQVFFTLDTLVNILPCAPPILGCIDSNATNYNLTATTDDGSCIYPPCGGFLTSNVYQNCQPNGQALTIFEWTLDTNVSCEPVKFHYWTPFNGPYQYGLNPNSANFAVNAGTPNMPPNWSVPHFGQVEFVDGTMSDTIFYTPYSCIPGCMDSTQTAYNPWANIDDGSCSGTTCDPTTETQITIEIRLDNWPQETGWTLTDGMGGTFNTPDGTYTYNDIGITYTYTYCVSATGPFEFVLSDTYGDGIQGNGQPNSAGDVVIYDCNGDTITYLSGGTWLDGNQTPVGVSFGTVAYSTPQFGVPCAGPPIIDGCMDPAYVQYNPLANNSAPWLCYWLHTYGCTDSTSFNYDPTATINDLVDGCNYTLTIKDGAADGWGNSYLGVVQGNDTWIYTMGPGSYQQTFPLNLNTDLPVTVYYFEIPNAQNPDPQQTQFQTYQNSFTLTNADGVILLEEGTNPFANNGLGALQGFKAPFWATYSATPYCGDYCIPTILGCLDPTAFNYIQPIGDSLIDANTSDGSCIPVVLGCTNPLAFNYDSLANTDDNSCVAEVIGCMDSTAFNFNSSANTNDQSSCIPVILGCMDDLMFNYNAAANTNDGSCVPFIYGCTDLTAFNYDPTANTNNFSCIPVVFGCTDPTMFNFDINANIDNSSCLPYVYGCTDPTAWNYDPLANTSVGCVPFYYGCTDPTMFNYDPNANTDDNSCVPYILGCNDITALNYDSTANVNTGCVYPILGCTDPTMFNYNLNANVDDGTCIAFAYGCTDATAWNYDSLANTSVGCIAFAYGCTDQTMFNYNPLANTDDGTCYPIILGCMDTAAFNYDSLANTNFGCNQVFLGCTDVTAFNYNYLANVDDGSCIPVVLGCIDVNALNFDSLANTNVGCIYPIPGCTDPAAFNYNVNANTDDSSCVPVVIGCTDPSALNYNSTANTNSGCVYPIYGCTDPSMFNYDPLANTDDNSCVPVIIGCMDATQFNFDPTANTPSGNCIPYAFGCMDSTMFNYDPLANTDNGNCIPFIYGCTDATALNYDPLANTNDNSCIPFIYGCTDSTMFNYNPLANTDNGSCLPFVYGCTDAAAFNYNPLANTNDNSCCLIDGCTDSLAVNYNEFACFDDNSCITAVPGCTDVAAFNYDPTANVTDSTACLYDAGCYGGPGVPYWLNDNCYAWVIDVDNNCCTVDWDSYCVNLYDYCQQGMPTNIEDLLRENDFAIYPNPTRDVINLAYKQNAKIDLYGPLGELITSGENIKQIDLNAYSNGIYVLYVTYNNKTITHKIVKQ